MLTQKSFMRKAKESNKNKVIKVNYLARVEGEGSLFIRMQADEVKEVKFKIFEPPRFFEAFLRGRSFEEVPDITARICGICPVAYQMSSSQAIESAFGVRIPPYIHTARRLLYCGEWIESHLLHMVMLHAPDFFGLPSVVELSKEFPEMVKKTLLLKKTGNRIVSFLGGREIHPINVKVGGFWHLPPRGEFLKLKEEIKNVLPFIWDILKWVSSFSFPDFENDYEFVSLGEAKQYPILKGKLISNKGLNIPIKEYDNYFKEIDTGYSNALHSYIKARGAYFCGPLARINLNFDKLPTFIRKEVNRLGFNLPCFNPFKSIIARAVEVVYAFYEAINLIEIYLKDTKTITPKPAVRVKPKTSCGWGITEAPRGILYHRYFINNKGLITEAKIVPPTSQNQKMMEEDLRKFVQKYIKKPQEILRKNCEQAIRNYDPCISCATHFLKLKVVREL